MAVDSKYGMVTTERGTIGEDEPVVVFRAQDALLPKVLEFYHLICSISGSPAHHLDAIEQAKYNVEEWQAENGSRMPVSASLAPKEH